MLHRVYRAVFIAAICIAFSVELFAQPWNKPSIIAAQQPEPMKPNLKLVQQRFEDYWKSRSPKLEEEGNVKEGGYQQFRRWEWFAKQRLYPSGNPVHPEILFKEYQKLKKEQSLHRVSNRVANWQYIGQQQLPTNNGGAGRINVFRVHPQNNNIIYIGAASGGVWKTTDGGSSWTALSDFLPSISVADIAINPRYPDSLYVATGDGYGYEVSDGFWGGTYSAGVLVSPDGGMTWQSSGLSFDQTNSEIIQRLIIHPNRPEILLASSRDFLHRSNDGGQTWNSVRVGHHFDIEFHTVNPDTIFATDEQSLLWSTDAGLNWTVLQSGLCNGRLSLAVTPADPSVVYVLCESGELYRSNFLGVNLIAVTPPTDANFYGYYDCVLAVSPNDENVVICGGVDMVRSTDGGNTWSPIGTSVHVDQKYIDFQPGSGQVVYSCNDGGFYRSGNQGTGWTNLSAGLAIKQYYRMAHSTSDPYTVYCGSQDNGTDRLTAGTWRRVSGGDGMDCMVDYSNDQIAYVSYQYGALRKSTNGGLSFTDIAPSNGDWVAPYAMHPFNPSIIYGGYEEVYKSDDGGQNWYTISNGQFNEDITCLDVNRFNPDVIYASNLDQLFRTVNGGVNWTNIVAGLPVSSAVITGITSSATDPDEVWVTFSGYSAGTKVFHSTNGGLSWTNISGTLPNIPVNCIVYQRSSPDALYIGTDLGVYYTDSTLNDWVFYNTGLPNVIVFDLDIHYGQGKLRAATYGRGLWESDLNSFTPPSLDAAVSAVLSPVGTLCYGLVTPVIVLQNRATDTLTNVLVSYYIDNVLIDTMTWYGLLLPGEVDTFSLSAMTVYPGSRTFRVELSDPNGGTDQQTANDSRSTTFVLLQPAVAAPVSEDFESQVFPSSNWNVSDPAGLYNLNSNTGGFQLSSTSLYANCYDISSGEADLISPVIDLSVATAPVYIDFNVAYAMYSSQYHDSLVVLLSDDCGETYMRVYEKGDDSLATAPNSGVNFVPSQASDWRAERVDISNYIGSEVVVKFQVISGYGNDIYLDDINIYGSTSSIHSIDKVEPLIYPNPAADRITLQCPAVFSSVQLLMTDLLGREVLRSESSYRTFTLDVSGIDSGCYNVTIIGDGRRVSTSKVLLQR